jgi:transaldolase
MQLYLDTAHPADWTLPAGCAPVAGVTTNPTLIHAAGLPLTLATYAGLIAQAKVKRIPALMLQLPSPDAAQGAAWAQQLSAAAQGVALTFKLPCHPSYQACHTALKRGGFATLLTGVSNPMQLLWAQAQGADWVAPYLSRMQADGRTVQPFIEACCAVQYDGGPKLMAASVKTVELFASLIAAGAAAMTVKPEFAASLALDTMTHVAMAQFDADAAASLSNRFIVC